MENQQHLLPFAGTSEKHLRLFKKGTALSHRHSCSEIIESLQSNLIADFRLKITAVGCYTDSWLLEIAVTLLAFSTKAFILRLTVCNGMQKDPNILKANVGELPSPVLVVQTSLQMILSFYAGCCQL